MSTVNVRASTVDIGVLTVDQWYQALYHCYMVPADESGSNTDEEHVEEQQSDKVKPKLVPVARYAVCI